MILLAIAVLFIAWGIFMLSRGAGTSGTDTQAAATTTSASAEAGAGTGAGAGATSAASDAQPSGEQSTAQQSETNTAVASSAVTQQQETNNSGASDNSAQGGKVPVRVLNNSMVQGLGQRVADQVRNQEFTVSEVGNYSESTFPSSVVYYTPGKGDEEKTARSLAESLGITAAPRDAQAERLPAGVVLVITQDLHR